MLLFGFPFPKTPATESKPARDGVAFHSLDAATLAPDPYTERHCQENAVDGLGHYIDSRLCGERFRID